MSTIPRKRSALAVSIALSLVAVNANASSILDLTDNKKVDPNLLPLHNGGTTLADIDRSSDLYTQLVLTNEVGKYDTLLIHADLQKWFAITQPLIVASDPKNELHVMGNIIFQGKNQNTDKILFYSDHVGLSSPLPGPGTPYQIWMSSIKINDAHLILNDPNPNDPFDNGLIIAGLQNLALNNGTFEMSTVGSIAGLNLTNPLVIDSESGENTIKAIIYSPHSITLNVKSGSTLNIAQGFGIEGGIRSMLNMESGSKLNITRGFVDLTSNPTLNPELAATVSGAEINLIGSNSYLNLTNLKMKDSKINLDINTHLRVFTPITADGTITFSGDNTISLNDGAYISTSLDPNDLHRGRLYVDGGTTTFKVSANGTPSTVPAINTSEIYVKNGGHLILDGFFSGLDKLRTIRITDSKFTHLHSENIYTDDLLFDNSQIISSGVRYKSNTFSFSNSHYSMLDPVKPRGVTFEGNTANRSFQLSGKNIFDIRITPPGVEIAPGYSFHSDSYYFKNLNVVGFDTISLNLKAFDSHLSALDYATGGANHDGVYDAIWLDQSTADKDHVTLTLDPSMPALLQATQVATPSVNQAVSVKLSVLPTSSLLTTPGLTTPNQQSALSLLINSGSQGNGTTQNALHTVTTGQLAQQTNTLHPELYASNMTVALEHDGMVMNTVLQNAGRFGTGAHGTDPSTRYGLWVDASYVDGQVEASAGLNDFGYSLASLSFGKNLIDNSDHVLGAFLAYANQKMNVADGIRQDFSGKAYHAGVYWHAHDLHGFELRSMAGLSYGQNDAIRKSEFAGIGDTHRADYDSQSLYVGLKAAKQMYANSWLAISPEFGLNYIHYRQDGLQEKGDANLSLFIDSANAQSLVGSLGVNIRFASFTEKSKLYPMAMFAYEHDWLAGRDSTHQISAGVVSSPDYTQQFIGQNRGADAWVAGLGLGSEVSENFQMNGGVVASKTSNGREWGLGLNMRYAW